jgi:uncharacterized tellurite resistance protein B-like protein
MISKELDIDKITKIAALLVHAAKIDNDYHAKERVIILKFINSFVKNDTEKEKILKEAEKLEKNSNQILDFTNIIKKNSLESKTIVIEELWKIIISDNETDEFESNLMRRICGLIYYPDKLSGEIKLKLLKKF